MATVFQFAALVAMLAVGVVLLRGLWNMMRAGDSNTSQKLMQMRVFLQFIAIVLIVGALYFARPA